MKAMFALVAALSPPPYNSKVRRHYHRRHLVEIISKWRRKRLIDKDSVINKPLAQTYLVEQAGARNRHDARVLAAQSLAV